MTTSTVSADEPAYTGLLESVAKAASGPVLFQTDADGLFDAFLSHLPPHLQQHHNCHACRRFVYNYGGLASVAPDGSLVPDMWRPEEISYPYAESVAALFRIVRRARITSIFLAGKNDKPMGVPVTGPWRHMSCVPNTRLCPRETALKNAHQLAAEKLEEYGMLQRSLTEFRVEPCSEALRLLTDGQLYRSEKCVGVAKWLVELHQARAAVESSRQKENLTWAAVATAPAGFCHVRGGMIGTLLEDIVAGLPFADIKRKFDTKMSPLAYQRPQALPSAGNIAQAEKVVAELGAAGSLARRFARLSDLETIWTPTAQPEEPATGGVFGHLKPKAPAGESQPVLTPPQTMTWVKFAATVLPNALSIEYLVTHGIQSFAAYVTAVDPSAPNILQWGNSVSWYLYNGGSAPSQWKLSAGWTPVTALSFQPSQWGGANEHHGEGVLFCLKGAVDTRDSGVGLFPECLRAEFRAIRSTIESYSRTAKLSGRDEAEACGVMIQKAGAMIDRPQFRVRTKLGVSTYRLDRWD